jgi:hypothetical protein
MRAGVVSTHEMIAKDPCPGVGDQSQEGQHERRGHPATTRYFVVLGEELNCRRAAEKLFISQPALSTAIKQLEHQFGVALLLAAPARWR